MSVASSAGSPTLQARHHRGQRVDELVVTAFADQDAGLRDAGLAVVHQAGRFQPGHRLVDVGVVEDDRRRLAAQFQAHPLELLSAQRGDPAPDGTGTGERDLVHTGMAHQRLADVRSAGQHRHHAFGQADLLDHLGQPQSVQRCFGCGLDDDRAAGDQGGDQLGHDQELRDVPWHDRADHTHRGPAQVCFAEHALAAFHPGEVAGGSQREVHHRRRGRRLAQPAEAARRPHLVGDQVGHLVDVAAVDRGQLLDLGHPLGMGPCRGHGPWSKACRAAATAASTSSGPATCTWPIGSSECGEITASCCGLAGLRHCPPMNSSS